VKQLCIVWLIGSTTQSKKTQPSAKKTHIMKISIDSINSASVRQEYRNLHCNYGEFLGTYTHPENSDQRDWDVALYRVVDTLVFVTNGDPVWANNADFDLLVEEYGININDVE
jgi:hypothetical protein